jgi:hypothetical protein
MALEISRRNGQFAAFGDGLDLTLNVQHEARRAHKLYIQNLGTHLRKLTASLRDPYRPEQHYMRGPGPKWYAKHPR